MYYQEDSVTSMKYEVREQKSEFRDAKCKYIFVYFNLKV